jgi:hypothetical protein
MRHACALGVPCSRSRAARASRRPIPTALRRPRSQSRVGEWKRDALDCGEGTAATGYRFETAEPGTLRIAAVRVDDGRELPEFSVALADADGKVLEQRASGGKERVRFAHPRRRASTRPTGRFTLAVQTPPEDEGALGYELRVTFAAKPRPKPPRRVKRRLASAPCRRRCSRWRRARRRQGGADRPGQRGRSRAGQRGRLLVGGKKLAEIEIIDVYPDGSRARIRGSLGAAITPQHRRRGGHTTVGVQPSTLRPSRYRKRGRLFDFARLRLAARAASRRLRTLVGGARGVRARLVEISGGRSSARRRSRDVPVTIGRDPGCDVVVPAGASRASTRGSSCSAACTISPTSTARTEPLLRGRRDRRPRRARVRRRDRDRGRGDVPLPARARGAMARDRRAPRGRARGGSDAALARFRAIRSGREAVRLAGEAVDADAKGDYARAQKQLRSAVGLLLREGPPRRRRAQRGRRGCDAAARGRARQRRGPRPLFAALARALRAAPTPTAGECRLDAVRSAGSTCCLRRRVELVMVGLRQDPAEVPDRFYPRWRGGSRASGTSSRRRSAASTATGT